MATYGRDVYRWKWDYRVRQLFNLANPAPGRGRAFTNADLNEYVRQDNAVTQDGGTVAPGQFTDALLQPKVDALARVLGQAAAVAGLPVIPRKPNARADVTRELNNVYPAGSMPTPAALAAARARVRILPAAPGAAAAQRGPAGPPPRPIGLPPIGPLPANPLPTDNIVLAANPPSLYEAIRDADIRKLARELSDPNYNPEQTFLVAIGDPGGPLIQYPPPAVPTLPPDQVGTQPPVKLELTPIQYAALKGLKGVVRYILINSTSDLTKKLNGKNIKQAVVDYRKLDTDKNEIRYMFDVVEAAIQDATDDFTGDKKLDANYGNGAAGDINKNLAKKLYEREYNDLKSPKPLPATAPKTSGILVDDAKKKGAEDGSRGSSKNPEFLPGATPLKTSQELEGYDKEYDKAYATYHGKKDGTLNESEDITKYITEFSAHYTPGPHKDEVDKLYKDAYNANRNKSTDLAKEAGYVGAYPASSALLSGNYFGFGPDLNKIIGFDMSGPISVSDTDIKYKEGFVEFVKNVQSLIGQAKYAGYSDGISKKTKYTTPGKIAVGGKEYAVDFGKLNTRLSTQLIDGSGDITSNPDYWQARDILISLKQRRDSSAVAVNTQNMINFLTAMKNRPTGVLDAFWLFRGPDTSTIRTHFGNDNAAALRANSAMGRISLIPPAAISLDNIPPKVTRILNTILSEITPTFTKSQVYDKVKSALSIFPEFEEVPVQSIPKGVKPDDPSLKNDINAPMRVQAVYDREFERGTKEAMRTRGGTRRKSKKSNRLTKKQGSKK